MSLHTWWLFVTMTFVISGTPGPNMLLIMSTCAREGLRAAIVNMAGCMTSLMLMLGLSAAGLGALLQAFPAVFEALRLLGAAYLAYLGVQCWRAPVQEQPDEVSTKHHTGHYRQGVLVAASNPKAILFAAAFFPQFLDPAAAQLPQFGVLLATFAVVEVAWYFVYAASGKQLTRTLRRAAFMRGFNRITGAIFVGFAVLMAASRG
ncbi:LysE family translocator [Rhodoferax sp. OV413]|uniref:LysE family translocator n=1 Tax=Rhodoferax sp. OV413 TaxID=1855285 RepID=UPI0025E0ACDC|nr:LysE family translocator [Rhodoferax sp. OV413]